MDHCSRHAFSDFFRRTATGVERTGGVGRVPAGVDTVDCSEFCSQRHAFWHSRFRDCRGNSSVPWISVGRSLHPDLSSTLWLTPYVNKLLQNTRIILQDALPRLGGSWASLLFLVGLMLGFRSAAVRRMRYFLLMCLAVFIVVQALGQTQLSEESPEVNSENLLVLFAPLVFIYGVSLFLTLLDQMVLPVRECVIW